MNYKQLVAEAWQFTQDNRSLVIWYGAIPTFFTTVFGIGYFGYQYFAFLSSPLFQNWHRSFLSLVFITIIDFLKDHRSAILPLVIIAVILVILYFILPAILEGGLIQMIARRRNGQQVATRKGFFYGLVSFLPLFEYRLFVTTFSMTSVVSILGTSLRNFGWGVLPTLLPAAIMTLIAIVILAVFFTYTAFYIVIDEDGTFNAMTKSFNLVLRNMEETLLLTILMLIIGLRIIIQILFVLLVPLAALLVVYFMALANLPDLGVILGTLIGVTGVLVAAYLNGIVHVFAISVWTFTFLQLTAEVNTNARDKGEQ